jgi:hypothetical protein
VRLLLGALLWTVCIIGNARGGKIGMTIAVAATFCLVILAIASERNLSKLTSSRPKQ